MMEIFAHRALFDSKENSILGIENYVHHGMGIELDLRFGKHGIYMSHDPLKDNELFEEACKILKKTNSKIALHIKEIEAVSEVVKLIDTYSIRNCFLFDTDYEKISHLAGGLVEVGFYASEKPENVTAKILWCDEVKSRWYDKEVISTLHKQNKILYAVSRESVEKCSMSNILSDWERLIKLGFDGICTNYPNELMNFKMKETYN